jgi:hypothetical protein
MLGVDLDRITTLMEEEEALFEASRPASKRLYAQGLKCYLYGAPMHWM